MSILVAMTSAVPTTAPTTAAATAAAAAEAVTQQHLLIAAGMLAWSLAIAFLLGTFRRGSVSGDTRLRPGTKPVSVFLVVIGGFVVWFGLQIAYMSVRAIEHRQSGAEVQFSAAALRPADFGFLSTVPYIAGLLALMAGDFLARRSLPRELGWSIDRLPKGVAIGALAMVSVMPLMSGASIALEWLYQSVGFRHPTEHELLTVLGKSSDPLTTALIIGGATLLAPVFEEFLFRGHIQTLLVRLFTPSPVPQSAPPVAAMATTAASEHALPIPPPISPALEYERREPPIAVEPAPALRWLAIFIWQRICRAVTIGRTRRLLMPR